MVHWLLPVFKILTSLISYKDRILLLVKQLICLVFLTAGLGIWCLVSPPPDAGTETADRLLGY